MAKRIHHAVYDLKYHLVWIPKYWESLLQGPIEKRLEELFCEIAEENGFEILEMELIPDHVHLFVSAAPRCAPGKIVGTFKAITSKIIFKEIPQIKRRLWGGHLWSAGYYAGSVGDKVTAETIKRYIRHQRQMNFNW